jgi:3-phenylpropionate/cinnamic acid dioxygenase small subunit
MYMLHRSRYAFAGLFAVLVACSQGLSAAEPDTRQQDTVAIEQLIIKYAHAYDSLDVEGYVGVFAEDARFTFTGNELNGREEIRGFITGAKERADSAPATTPPTRSFHSISNTLIEFDSPTTARHRSYWQVIAGPVGVGPYIITNMGYYDDVVTKQNGQWLIQSRNIPQ